MTREALLTACKLACRISGDAINSEISDLIDAAFYDLEISGVSTVEGVAYTVENADALVVTAVKTYVKLNCGDLLDHNEAQLLSKSYDTQKAQLKMRRWSNPNFEVDS